MRLLVVGGTGTAGRVVAAQAATRGHDVAVLSRKPADHGRKRDGITLVRGDVTRPACLDKALRGVEGVIDCSNADSVSRRRAEPFFVTSSRNLVRAGAKAGVRHHLLLSIVGVEAFPFGYYQAKVAQEQAVIRAAADIGLRYTIARTTQFHDFATQLLARSRRGRFAFIPALRIQPVDLGEVADYLLSTVEGPPTERAPDLGGPRPEELTAMVGELSASQDLRLHVVRLPLPPAAARANRAGVLRLSTGVRGRVTFAEWLSRQR